MCTSILRCTSKLSLEPNPDAPPLDLDATVTLAEPNLALTTADWYAAIDPDVAADQMLQQQIWVLAFFLIVPNLSAPSTSYHCISFPNPWIFVRKVSCQHMFFFFFFKVFSNNKL